MIAPNERQLSQTYFRPLQTLDGESVQALLAGLAQRAVDELVADGADAAAIRTEYSADLRYKGQAYELTVALPDDAPDNLVATMAEQFHQQHGQAFGHSSPADPVDLVSLRVMAREMDGDLSAPQVEPDDSTPSMPSRMAFFGEDGDVETTVISRLTLARSGTLVGPLIVEEYDATTLVPPGWTARLGASASIILERQTA